VTIGSGWRTEAQKHKDPMDLDRDADLDPEHSHNVTSHQNPDRNILLKLVPSGIGWATGDALRPGQTPRPSCNARVSMLVNCLLFTSAVLQNHVLGKPMIGNVNCILH
jgi:hypothetical protein